jgi:hypothetical protein
MTPSMFRRIKRLTLARFTPHSPSALLSLPQVVYHLTGLDGTLQCPSAHWSEEREVVGEAHKSMLPHRRPQVQYLMSVVG